MRKMDRKGFTLIELLAVIVVLALIMILAVPAILNSMNNAKMKTFQMYGTRLLEKALEEYESQKMLNTVTKATFGENLCYPITALGFENHGNYEGFVEVHGSSLLGETTYTLHLTDDTFAYNGTSATDVRGDTSKISSTAADINKVHEDFANCSIKAEG